MIGAVSGVGGGVTCGAAGPLNFGGLNGAVGPASFGEFSPIKMQQLGKLLEGFTSAEVLLALMILSASGRKKDEDDGSSALALLAGLAVAGQLGHIGLGSGPGGIGVDLGCGASSGGMLNATV